MNFRFKLEESRIFDFLYFPRMLYYMEISENMKEDKANDQIASEEYLEFVRKAEEKLKPFSDEIATFYMKQYSYDYDFISLISTRYKISGYEREEEYLNMISSLSEDDIKRAIVYSIFIENEDYMEDVDKKVEEICANRDMMLSFIKELPIDSGSKWTLFLIVDNPREYAKRYVNLMTSLLPIFNELYGFYQDEVRSYGKQLEEYLNKNGKKGIKDITYSIIDPNILDGGEIDLLISLVFSYAISILGERKLKVIVWGLRMEEAFKKMKEISDRELTERVQIFKNLGDKTRYGVLKLIAQGETSIKNIASELGVSSATISYHINNFLTSKMVKLDKKDNKFNYIIDYDKIEEVIRGLKEDLNFPE